MLLLRTNLKNVLWITLPTLIFCWLIGEIVFRFIVPASEQPLYCFDQQFKLVHFEPNTSGLATFGRFAEVRGRWRVNNYGWNSGVDYIPHIGEKKPLVAVIGDSYVEAMQVDFNERFPEALQRLAGDQFLVYSFGISGAPLTHYLHMNRYLNRVFNPKMVVILVVHNDFDESLARLCPNPRFLQFDHQDGSFAEISPTQFQNSSFLRILRRSAVFRYLEMNCNVSGLVRKISERWARPHNPSTYNANIDVDRVAKERDLLRQATRFALAKLRAENSGRKLIIMMDGPRFDIYLDNLAGSNVMWLHEILREACLENQVEFVDLTKPFSEYWQRFHQRLEHLPIDAHWNKTGHNVAAHALWESLKKIGVANPSCGIDG
jgi:hypothetical protein